MRTVPRIWTVLPRRVFRLVVGDWALYAAFPGMEMMPAKA